MNVFNSRFLCLLVALLLSGGLQAAEANDPGISRFSTHDLDGDGYISLQEYKVFREKYLARQPRRDGAGGRQLRYRWRAMRFVEIDSNGDGLISEEEMLTALNRRFQQPCPGGRGRRQVNP